MPDAKFVLKEPNSNESTLVYLMYSFNDQRLKYSTGQKIKAKFWNPERQRAKETRQFPEYADLNTLLDKLATDVKNAHRKLLNANTAPTTHKLLLAAVFRTHIYITEK